MANNIITAELNGNDASKIRELLDLQVEAIFSQGGIQANITTTQLNFVNEYAKQIREYLAGGLNGITPGYSEGMPFKMYIAQPGLPTTLFFNGCLNQREGFEIVDPTTVKSKLQQIDDVFTLQKLAEGLSWESLYQQNVITDNDFVSMPYVVEKEFNFVDFALVAVATYMTARETHAAIQRTARDAVAFIEALPSPTAAIGAGLRLIIEATFTAILLVNLVRLVQDLIAFLISPVKFHKSIRVQTLLNRGSNYLGYTYSSTISEIANNVLAILPSKTNIDVDNQAQQIIDGLTVNQPGVGFPRAIDYGATFAELLALIDETFYAKFAVKNGVIEHHALRSSWWLSQASYQAPQVLNESIIVNMDECNKNTLIRFATDSNDIHTRINFTGTTYEVITEQITTNNIKCEQIQGLEKVEIPYALGNRKEGLNRFEKSVKELAEIIDDVVDFFGGNGDNAASIDARVGMLKLETDFLDVPKLMVIDNAAKLPVNNRLVWSAKYLWDNYHIERSFVGTNPTTFANANQWKIYSLNAIPFSYRDYLSVINNSYFYDCNGNPAQMMKVQWEPSSDLANITYRVRELWSKNFKETKIEV